MKNKLYKRKHKHGLPYGWVYEIKENQFKQMFPSIKVDYETNDIFFIHLKTGFIVALKNSNIRAL